MWVPSDYERRACPHRPYRTGCPLATTGIDGWGGAGSTRRRPPQPRGDPVRGVGAVRAGRRRSWGRSTARPSSVRVARRSWMPVDPCWRTRSAQVRSAANCPSNRSWSWCWPSPRSAARSTTSNRSCRPPWTACSGPRPTGLTSAADASIGPTRAAAADGRTRSARLASLRPAPAPAPAGRRSSDRSRTRSPSRVLVSAAQFPMRGPRRVNWWARRRGLPPSASGRGPRPGAGPT